MKNSYRTLIAVLAAVLVLGLGAGCSQTKEIGKGTTRMVRGEVGTVVEQSPQQVSAAIDAAVADLRLIKIGATTRPTKGEQAPVETVVVVRNGADARIQVAYRRVSDTQTRVVVSTGVLGNSELRDQVWDAVRIRLGVIALAPPAPANAPATVAAPSLASPSETVSTDSVNDVDGWE